MKSLRLRLGLFKVTRALVFLATLGILVAPVPATADDDVFGVAATDLRAELTFGRLVIADALAPENVPARDDQQPDRWAVHIRQYLAAELEQPTFLEERTFRAMAGEERYGRLVDAYRATGEVPTDILASLAAEKGWDGVFLVLARLVQDDLRITVSTPERKRYPTLGSGQGNVEAPTAVPPSYRSAPPAMRVNAERTVKVEFDLFRLSDGRRLFHAGKAATKLESQSMPVDSRKVSDQTPRQIDESDYLAAGLPPPVMRAVFDDLVDQCVKSMLMGPTVGTFERTRGRAPRPGSVPPDSN